MEFHSEAANASRDGVPRHEVCCIPASVHTIDSDNGGPIESGRVSFSLPALECLIVGMCSHGWRAISDSGEPVDFRNRR